MTKRTYIVASALTLSIASAACGGNLDVRPVSGDEPAPADTPQQTTGTEGSGTDEVATTETGEPNPGTVVDPDRVELPEEPEEPEVPEEPEEPADPTPTQNVPQTGPSVGGLVTNSCSVRSVRALSTQLIDQMNCLEPGVMKSFAGAPSISYGNSVFPYQQGVATDIFTAVAANNSGTVPVNSALRMIPSQYLLYQWYRRGLCNANLAARPGQSNHNGGLALDIGNSSTWRSRMRNRSYIDNVSGEPWHFNYTGSGGKDVRSLSVLAFQQLYNYNFPEDRISEDGVYGPQTEGALRASPAEGFAVVPTCAMSLQVGYPWGIPMDLEWEFVGGGLLGVKANVPNGIDRVEYFVNDQLVGWADRGTRKFESVLELPVDGSFARVEAVAFDAKGNERGREFGVVDASDDKRLSVRPLGGDNYELNFNGNAAVSAVEFYADGVLIDRAEMGERRPHYLGKARSVSAVLLGRKGEVLDVKDVPFTLRDVVAPQPWEAPEEAPHVCSH